MNCCYKKLIGLVILIAALTWWFVRHSGFVPYPQNPMQFMPNMHHTTALIPQRGYDFFANGASTRTPPEGVVPRDIKLYPYAKTVLATDVPRALNAMEVTKPNVLRGRVMYDTYCIVCHGPAGHGNGLIVPSFPQPPSLQSDRVRGLADSQIFHIITAGQNTMNGYGKQIRENDRWAIIHYIRALQLAEKPAAEDLKALEQVLSAPAE